MNVEIIELQRDLLLNQLMEVENQLIDSGIKRGLFEENVSKFMIMLYIQQHKDDIITNGNLKD